MYALKEYIYLLTESLKEQSFTFCYVSHIYINNTLTLP